MQRSREGAATNEAQRRRFIGIPSPSSSSLYLVVRRSQLKIPRLLMHADDEHRGGVSVAAALALLISRRGRSLFIMHRDRRLRPPTYTLTLTLTPTYIHTTSIATH